MSANDQIDRLEYLLNLELDPAFFAAKKISPRSALVAAHVLGALEQFALQPSGIIPTPEGGVNLEWETMEIEILPNGEWEGLFCVGDYGSRGSRDYEPGGTSAEEAIKAAREFLVRGLTPNVVEVTDAERP